MKMFSIKCYQGAPFIRPAAAPGCGHLDVLKWMYEHVTYSFKSRDMDAAASSGNMNTIMWLHEHRSPGRGCSVSSSKGS